MVQMDKLPPSKRKSQGFNPLFGDFFILNFKDYTFLHKLIISKILNKKFSSPTFFKYNYLGKNND